MGGLAASLRRDLRAEGRSARTGELYAQSIRFFGQWLQAQGMPDDLAHLTRPNIRA